MKEMLTNRTYQIIAGSALLVLLVLLYVTGSESEEAVTTQVPTQTSDVKTDVDKTTPVTVTPSTDDLDKTSEAVETTK